MSPPRASPTRSAAGTIMAPDMTSGFASSSDKSQRKDAPAFAGAFLSKKEFGGWSMKSRWVLPFLFAASLSCQAASQPSHSVTFDAHSFLIDGKPTYLWSGEFHPFRLPSPELWTDIFQKMKAAGFNTASIYFSWGYHSPKEGVYDFSGVRDMDRMLDAAR